MSPCPKSSVFANAPSMRSVDRVQCGFTLMEIIITIVELSIASVSMLSAFTSAAKTSADPMILHQAAVIAEAYMEEIQLKSFTIGPGSTRATYDDIRDYDGITNEPASDQAGVVFSGYSVTVTVIGQAFDAAITGDASKTISAANSMLITVSVNHDLIDPITLSGFRTKTDE